MDDPAVASDLLEFAFPMRLSAQRFLQIGCALGKNCLEEFVDIPSLDFLFLPTVDALRTTIPIGDRVLRVAQDDAVIREVEQVSLRDQMFLRTP